MGRRQRRQRNGHRQDSQTRISAEQTQSILHEEYMSGIQASDVGRFIGSMKLSEKSRQLFETLDSRETIEGRVSIIRELLVDAETDVELNDRQPMDDGDQSIPSTEPQRQILQSLGSRGGDFNQYMMWNAFSPFVGSIVRGETTMVRDALKEAFASAYSKMEETKLSSTARKLIPSPLREMLETRCTSMRLSPLLVCMSVHLLLNYDDSPRRGFNKKGHLGVAVALLRYGARPDAKDVIGKNIVHYGASGLATRESLVIVDYCIAAARVSAYFGQTVVMNGLQAKPEFNGKSVVLTGFDGPSGRCVVQLGESDGLSRREMSIQPSNLFQSVGGPCIEDKERNLVNDQDRTGATALLDISVSDRDDVVEFLAEKHGCSLDLEAANGMSVRRLALDEELQVTPLNRVLKKHFRPDGWNGSLINEKHIDSQQLRPDFQSYVDFMNGNGMDHECLALIAQMERSTEGQNSIFEHLLTRAGTNVKLNEEQDTGDGDQRSPSTPLGRQILRTLWFKGGDIGNGTMFNPCPSLIDATIQGNAMAIRTMLEITAAKAAHEKSPILTFVLESRSSSLRWSPLMLCVGFLNHPKLMQHNTIYNQSDHVGVAVTYLRFGARPDIKDVMGKNIVHYGAGVWATAESMLIVDYCIAAARVSAFYDQRVVIDGLQSSPELNYKSVILTGFDGPSGRCVVNLEESPGGPRRELSIKPCNLFESVGGPCIENVNRKLVDDQDRTGLTALHQVIMSTRDDVIEYLVNKHGCSMDLKDAHGVSTRDLAFSRDLPVLINRSLRKLARKRLGQSSQWFERYKSTKRGTQSVFQLSKTRRSHQQTTFLHMLQMWDCLVLLSRVSESGLEKAQEDLQGVFCGHQVGPPESSPRCSVLVHACNWVF